MPGVSGVDVVAQTNYGPFPTLSATYDCSERTIEASYKVLNWTSPAAHDTSPIHVDLSWAAALNAPFLSSSATKLEALIQKHRRIVATSLKPRFLGKDAVWDTLSRPRGL